MKIMSSCLAFLFLCFCPLLCSARDTITINTPLKDNPGETLVAAKQIFELGFFTPEGSDSNKRYVGIWYSRSKETIVWVANRADPVPGRGGVFALEENKLVIQDSDNGTVHTITDLDPKSSVSSDLRLRLSDSGNLMLTMNRSTLWQSFLSPTDTFLPGMNVENANFNLTSWTSNLDPSPGGFVFNLDQGQYSLTEKSNPYWKTTVSGQPRFEYDSPIVTYLKSENESGSNNSRIIMNSNGRLEFLTWSDSKSSWEIRWWEPKDACAVVDRCGSFASCSRNNIMRCKCLPGFEPKSSERWELDDYSEGCERKSPSICRNGLNTSDFLNLKKMKVGNEFEKHESKDEQECRDLCITKCSCQAYTYMELDDRAGKTMNRCRTWSSELNNIQEDDDGGHDLNLRVWSSDIAFSKRDCKPCSTNVIPYPLSTGPDCGMKTYSSFKCDNDTGQVNFDTPSGSYRVASIDSISHKFSIQVLNCTDTAQMNTYLQLNSSMPFQFLKCVHSSGKDPLYNGYQSIEAEVEWEPPLEPICSSPQDCGDWPESNCTRRGKEMMKRCVCNEPFHWDGIKVRCVAVIQNVNKVTENRKQLYFVLLGTIIAATFLSCAAFYVYRLRRNNIGNRREHMRRRHTNVEFHLRDSEKRARDFIDSGQFTKEHSKDIDVPFIDLESLLAATDNFSDANKLGRGGFGPVYKGTFPGGQEIAIKRLSSGSGQGLDEFKNEVTLIAKLQHRNLVRLVGYCFEGYERMLIYEYMPNKSLDCYIFDRTRCLLLNWNLRLNIIIGIARGLLYLHNDSRLRIIHRDLKTSNILLDEEMNPKISDFGLARIFGGKQSEATTEKVVGTYGYMSPEYALEGLFSVKSDVFSYGVVVLEILSGKKSVGFYSSTQALSLLSYVWRLWKEDDALSLMDQCLHETCNPNEFLRCLNVALLCVQEDPSDRPTILNVLQMIGSDSNLPSPKQPAFVMRRASLSTEASSSSNVLSNSEMTTSMVEGR